MNSACRSGIARKRGVHRRVVRRALDSAVPPERKVPQRISPKLTPQTKAFIDKILVTDRKAPRKQRHTTRRIWQRVTEGARGGSRQDDRARLRAQAPARAVAPGRAPTFPNIMRSARKPRPTSRRPTSISPTGAAPRTSSCYRGAPSLTAEIIPLMLSGYPIGTSYSDVRTQRLQSHRVAVGPASSNNWNGGGLVGPADVSNGVLSGRA